MVPGLLNHETVVVVTVTVPSIFAVPVGMIASAMALLVKNEALAATQMAERIHHVQLLGYDSSFALLTG
jgi:hypothetical protein